MTYRPFPPRPGSGGGGGSYDDTALRARVAAGETTNATQDGTLRDHAGRLIQIEETPPFDDTVLRKGIGDLGSALAAEARDRAAGDRALAERAETADAAAGRLADRLTAVEGRPAPVPYDDTALSGRVGAVETGVEGLDGRLKTVEGRPATVPYDDTAIRKAISDETAARTAADTSLEERLDGAETTITRHAGRLKAVEDRPVPAAYDDTAIRGRLTSAEESIGAVDGRVKTLEGRPNSVPYDDTPLRGRLAALETADVEFDDALDQEIDARAEADRQLGLRIEAVSSAGYDDTALKTRVTALEDRPVPGAFDDAALREADRQLGLRIDGLPAPFDPAPLAAADAELGRRIGVIEDRPAPAFDDTALREADRQLGLRIDGLPAPFDPAPLVAADAALGKRTDDHDVLFGQVRDGMSAHLERLMSHDRALTDHRQRIVDLEGRPVGSGGSSGGNLRLLSKRRIRVSGAVDLDTIAPAGTAVVDIESIGGGASGVSSRQNQNNSPSYAHGGNPGEVARGRVQFEPGLRLDILVGAGGATALAQASTAAAGVLQNAGSPTSVRVTKGATVYGVVFAPGGRTWGATNASGSFPSTALATVRSEGRENLLDKTGALGGVAPGNVFNAFGLAHGPLAIDGPAGGGACVSQHGSDQDIAQGGNGGGVRYSVRPGAPHLETVAGGRGGFGHNNATNADATPGQNPLPDEAGTYGSGGGGSRYRSGATGAGVIMFANAAAGAFPGGGGGGAFTPSNAPAQESPAGAGGDGCVDLYFYGVAG